MASVDGLIQRADADPGGAGLPSTRRLRRRTMLSYGLGSVAYGVKDNGFQTFLLLFYNQVIGLPAVSVGTAIMLALIVDAFIDPVIGAASDRTRSRWGRRHPWMYASALPIALGWLLLWNPPELGRTAMLGWVFASSIIVRSAVSAYEVPSAALTPELSADYDERTRIIAYRYVFGWIGGLAMAYSLFLVPAPGQANGLLNREGYQAYAVTGAALMFIAILVSAAGTHREIGRLPKPIIEPLSPRQIAAELLETIRNKAFLILMAAGLFAYVAQGVSFALSNYLYNFVWRLRGGELTLLPVALMTGVLLAFELAPRAAARFGKREAGAVFAAAGTALLTLPYLLRLAGLFPAVGEPAMVPLLFGIIIVNIACSVSAMMIGGSMMADVVEHSEVSTGRRSEGVFFAGGFFIQKCSSGVGIFAAGVILSLAGFPEGARPGAVPAPVVDRLTVIFCVAYLMLGLGAAWFYTRFPFGRGEHDERLRALSATSPDPSDVHPAQAPPHA